MIDSILTFCDEVLSNPIWFYVITLLIKIVICFAITILFIPICVYIERRVAAWIQDRVGPNRAGIPLSIFRRFGMKSDLPFKKTLDYFGLPHDGKIANLCRFFRLDRDIPIFGLVQPMVDGGKLFLKQDFTPPFVRRVYFWIAPMLVLAPPLMTAAVIPFAGDLHTSYGNVNMAVANLSVGPLWVFAISSLSVYGLVLAGWSSNSKFPFLGGVRSSAQMISYEISMGLSIIPVLMIYSTLDLSNIVEYQAANGWLLLPVWGEGLSWQRWILLVPVALRHVRMRDGPRGRLPHGILFHEVRAVLHGRIRRHGGGLLPGHHALPRRLVHRLRPGRLAERTRRQLGGGALPAGRLRAQAPLLRLLLRLGALDAAPLPL